jgi:hypothetical protein
MLTKNVWRRITFLGVALLVGAGITGWIAANAEYCSYRPNVFGVCGAIAAMRNFMEPVDLVSLAPMALVAIALGALLFKLHKTNVSLGETSEQIREARKLQTAANLRMQAANVNLQQPGICGEPQ